MKINLLQAIVNAIDDVTTLTGGALIYSPELDLNAQTKPFAVVRSLTDTERLQLLMQQKSEYTFGFMFIPYLMNIKLYLYQKI
jgi:hypothetical protein